MFSGVLGTVRIAESSRPPDSIHCSGIRPVIRAPNTFVTGGITLLNQVAYMDSVTVTRVVPASLEDVREAMLDVEPFTRAAGFDEVVVDGPTVRVANDVGIAEISLELEVVDHSDATLAYEQREGIFEEMQTAFTLRPTPDGTEMKATTEFAIDIALVGGVLDATVISRQRRRELEAQFDYIEEVVDTRRGG